MAQSDLQNKLRALLPGESVDVACAAIEEIMYIAVPASADAGTSLANQIPVAVGMNATVVGARYCQSTSGANNASNYATIALTRRYAGGTLSATVASIATSTAAASISAHVGLALTVATSLADVSAGDTLLCDIGKSGTGLSTNSGTLQVRLRRR